MQLLKTHQENEAQKQEEASGWGRARGANPVALELGHRDPRLLLLACPTWTVKGLETTCEVLSPSNLLG